MITGAAPPVVAWQPATLNSGCNMARTAATTTGKVFRTAASHHRIHRQLFQCQWGVAWLDHLPGHAPGPGQTSLTFPTPDPPWPALRAVHRSSPALVVRLDRGKRVWYVQTARPERRSSHCPPPLRCVVFVGAQQPDNLLGVFAGQTLHVGNATRGQRTGQNHHTDFRHTQRRRGACAAPVKALVRTLTDGTPRDSVATVSWRPHAVQDPQSAIPWIMALHSTTSASIVSSAQGAPAKLGGADNFLDPIVLLQDFL